MKSLRQNKISVQCIFYYNFRFGFVEFENAENARTAVEAMDSKDWNGNILKIAVIFLILL